MNKRKRKQAELKLDGQEITVRLPSRKPNPFEQRQFVERYAELLKQMPKRITK